MKQRRKSSTDLDTFLVFLPNIILHFSEIRNLLAHSFLPFVLNILLHPAEKVLTEENFKAGEIFLSVQNWKSFSQLKTGEEGVSCKLPMAMHCIGSCTWSWGEWRRKWGSGTWRLAIFAAMWRFSLLCVRVLECTGEGQLARTFLHCAYVYRNALGKNSLQFARALSTVPGRTKIWSEENRNRFLTNICHIFAAMWQLLQFRQRYQHSQERSQGQRSDPKKVDSYHFSHIFAVPGFKMVFGNHISIEHCSSEFHRRNSWKVDIFMFTCLSVFFSSNRDIHCVTYFLFVSLCPEPRIQVILLFSIQNLTNTKSDWLLFFHNVHSDIFISNVFCLFCVFFLIFVFWSILRHISGCSIQNV